MSETTLDYNDHWRVSAAKIATLAGCPYEVRVDRGKCFVTLLSEHGPVDLSFMFDPEAPEPDTRPEPLPVCIREGKASDIRKAAEAARVAASKALRRFEEARRVIEQTSPPLESLGLDLAQIWTGEAKLNRTGRRAAKRGKEQ